jgi:hypothetical protein
MKSDLLYLMGVYEAIFSQIVEDYPHLSRDCERDLSRLHSLVEARGLSYLMIDLPSVSKHFDRCLATERLTKIEKPGFGSFRPRGVIPRLFKGLFLHVFNEDGTLRANLDPRYIQHIRLLLNVGKKMKVKCADSVTWKHVNEFFQIDREVRSPSLNWDEDELRLGNISTLHFGDTIARNRLPLFEHNHISDYDDEDSYSGPEYDIAETTQRVADAFSASIGEFNPELWRPKHGRGAVADLDLKTQFKYEFRSWPEKLSRVFPFDLFAFANYSNWVEHVTHHSKREISLNEPACKLIAVPKTLKGPRLIASEPVAHQWAQQCIRDFLVSSLAKSPFSDAIHLHDQRWNQNLAREASLTGSHATIDLSSASDRMSCWLVERLFRRIPSLVEALHASRTRWIFNPIDKKSPKFSRLRKFACQGSAVTFPVQTIGYTVMAVASILHVRKLPVTYSNIQRAAREVQIYGDDIIAPMDSVDVLLGLLGTLGFKVNIDKTHRTGKFRESCGVDAYIGTDVTPSYVSTYPDVSRPESIGSSVDIHNNFVNRGYFRVAQFLKWTVQRLGRFNDIPYVPIDSGKFGWSDYGQGTNSHLRTRWNERLHRSEKLISTLTSRVKRLPTELSSELLQYFTEVSGPPEDNSLRLGLIQRPTQVIKRRWEPYVL